MTVLLRITELRSVSLSPVISGCSNINAFFLNFFFLPIEISLLELFLCLCNSSSTKSEASSSFLCYLTFKALCRNFRHFYDVFPLNSGLELRKKYRFVKRKKKKKNSQTPFFEKNIWKKYLAFQFITTSPPIHDFLLSSIPAP